MKVKKNDIKVSITPANRKKVHLNFQLQGTVNVTMKVGTPGAVLNVHMQVTLQAAA